MRKPELSYTNQFTFKDKSDTLALVEKQMESASKGTQRFLRQIVAPGSAAAKPSPALSPFTGASRHLRRITTLKATGANQQFAVKLQPTLSEFLAFGVAVPSIGHQLLVTGSMAVPKFTSGANHPMGQLYANARDRAPAILVASTPIPGHGGVPDNCYGYSVLSTVAVSNLTVNVVSNTTAQFIVHKIDRVGVHTTEDMITIKGQSVLFTGPSTNAIGQTLYMGVEVILGEVSYNMRASANMDIIMPLDLNVMNVVNDEWIERGQVSQHRISSMSVLASYRGNAIESAGVIAGALIRGLPARNGVEPLYDIVARQPEKAYNGPLQNGCYAYWVPQDINELDFDDEPPTTTIMLAGTFVDAGGALEITVDVIVDFYSPLQIFEKIPFPPMNDAAANALHYLNTLNPVMCNPKHWGNIKRILGEGANGVKDVVNWGVSNKELLAAVAAALSSLL